MAKLIGLIGYARSGKSTVAGILAAQHGFRRQRFAGPLKDMLRALGLGDYEIEGDGKEQPCALLSGRTPRHAMITLGTEWGRGLIAPTFWLDLARVKASALLADKQSAAFEDCRFQNEADLIRDLGGEIWRVVRPGVGGEIAHASEREHLAIAEDVTLHNNGDFDKLAAQIRFHVGNAP